MGRIKGEQRRRRAEALLRAGEIDQLKAFFNESGLLDPELSPRDREAWGAIHPSNMGGEYLEELEDDEVEIARVAIASATGDVISIRARKTEDGIIYAIVDEYDQEYVGTGTVSERPLSTGELIELIDRADLIGWDFTGGLVFSILESWRASDKGSPGQLLGAVTVSSSFYPDLHSFYETRIDEWVARLI